jgi:hypothetical protein
MFIASLFLLCFLIFGFSFYASGEVDRLLPIYMKKYSSGDK